MGVSPAAQGKRPKVLLNLNCLCKMFTNSLVPTPNRYWDKGSFLKVLSLPEQLLEMTVSRVDLNPHAAGCSSMICLSVSHLTPENPAVITPRRVQHHMRLEIVLWLCESGLTSQGKTHRSWVHFTEAKILILTLILIAGMRGTLVRWRPVESY